MIPEPFPPHRFFQKSERRNKTRILFNHRHVEGSSVQQSPGDATRSRTHLDHVSVRHIWKSQQAGEPSPSGPSPRKAWPWRSGHQKNLTQSWTFPLIEKEFGLPALFAILFKILGSMMKFWDKFFLALILYIRNTSPTDGSGGILLLAQAPVTALRALHNVFITLMVSAVTRVFFRHDHNTGL